MQDKFPRGSVEVCKRNGYVTAFIYAIRVGLLLPADMSRPVDRHIIEQRWRKEGPLDLLVRRSTIFFRSV